MNLKVPWAGKRTNLWIGFSACLLAMIFYGIGGGGFSLLIVGYLEKQGAVVTATGSVMSLMSLVEATFSLVIGHIYRRRWTRETLIAGILFNLASALILSTQPQGVLIWFGTSLTGAGFGIVVVVMYLAVIERRPPEMKMGLAVGLYTASIAAGNGLGSLIIGWMTDLYGFRVAFLATSASYILAILCLLVVRNNVVVQEQPASTDNPVEIQMAAQASFAAWMLSMISALLFASLNVLYDVLFPIYALRTGMTFTLIGLLGGIKNILAGLVRPFVGAWINHQNVSQLNNGSLIAMTLGTFLIPFSGFGLGLMAVVGLMGASFGAVRTTSAALAILGQGDPQIVSRRVSYYNTCITVAQTIAPWFVSLLATYVEIRLALVIGPACMVALFGLGQRWMPGMAARWQKRSMGSIQY